MDALILKDESPLVIQRTVATKLGLNAAIVLQQFHYFMRISELQADGETWIRRSLSDLREMFPFWSTSTIERTIRGLERDDFLISGSFNDDQTDRSKWFRINYERLNTAFGQNDGIHLVNVTGCNPSECRNVEGRDKSYKKDLNIIYQKDAHKWNEILKKDKRYNPRPKRETEYVKLIETEFAHKDLEFEADECYLWLNTTPKGLARKSVERTFVNWLKRKGIKTDERKNGTANHGDTSKYIMEESIRRDRSKLGDLTR